MFEPVSIHHIGAGHADYDSLVDEANRLIQRGIFEVSEPYAADKAKSTITIKIEISKDEGNICIDHDIAYKEPKRRRLATSAKISNGVGLTTAQVPLWDADIFDDHQEESSEGFDPDTGEVIPISRPASDPKKKPIVIKKRTKRPPNNQ